ncbi:MAG: hypothetical protein MAG794_00192 [Gammaproteobacteria bacterium]|nr:hypothetical protein [Gammaproteobacteria bacterium]
MHFCRDSGASAVLESSFALCKLRFSALASCVALPHISLYESARCFFSLTEKLLVLFPKHRVVEAVAALWIWEDLPTSSSRQTQR